MTDLHDTPTPDGPVSRHQRADAVDERQTTEGPLGPDRVAEGESKGQPVRLAILGALVALLGLAGGWPMLVVVLGVIVMIFLHELGHFLAAKWSDMQVTEFFIGFGPRIWSFRRGETEYGLKAIPAGAYVKITGMSMLEEVDDEHVDRTYRVKSYPRRLLVAVAGSGMHFTQALVLLFLLFGVVGIPGGGLIEDRTWEVGQVLDGSAADDAGLRPGDRILAIDGDEVESFQSMRDEVTERPGDSVTLTVRRAGDTFDVPLTVGTAAEDPSVGQLGVARELITSTVGLGEAVTTSFKEFGAQSAATLGFFTEFFTPSGIGDFAGKVADGRDDSTVEQRTGTNGQSVQSESPDEGRVMSIVGAVRLGADLTENGILGFIVFFIAINITIGIFNLLPVLPLDGGHVVIATYERIREFFTRGERYHVDMMKLMPLVYAVFLGLILLGVSTIYLDLIDPPA